MPKTRKPLNRADFEVVHKEMLPDGRFKLTMRNGHVGYAAPLPGGDWEKRVSKAMCDIQYKITLRKMAEEKHQPPTGA